MMELEGGETLHNFSASFSLLPTFLNVFASIFEKEEQVPKVDDNWIPRSSLSPNHFIRFFILELNICFKLETRS